MSKIDALLSPANKTKTKRRIICPECRDPNCPWGRTIEE